MRILWVIESKAPSVVPGTLQEHSACILAICGTCDPSAAEVRQNKLLYGLNALHAVFTQIFVSALLNNFTLDSKTLIF